MRNFLILILVFQTILGCGSDDTTSEQPPVISPVEPDVLSPSNVREYIVDANVTPETAALFYNLKALSRTQFAVGQQDAFNGFYNNASGESDIKKTTGNDPALLGSDFMFITDAANDGQPSNWFFQQETKIIADVKQAYSKGMINTFCWHLREPYNEQTFYAADMTAEQRNTAFASILPGGENHDWYKAKLDKVASVLNNLTAESGERIPVIFRPFHEFDGSWFWWGAAYATPEQYKTAYRFTVEYLRDVKNVHNVLYAFSPDNSYTSESNYLSRYPGDDYVDILGMDNYGDFNNQGSAGAVAANNKLQMLSGLAIEKVKIAALTETGYQVTDTNSPVSNWFSTHIYNAMTENQVQMAFVMFWNNSQNAYYVPVPSSPNAADFISFAIKPRVVLEHNLPEMYQMPD